jgi:hypothetical protein
MTSRIRLLLLTGAAALAAAIPALGQNRQAPQSILPPGFGDTQNLPPPEAKAPPAPPRPQQNATPQPQQQAQTNASSSDVAGAGTEGGALEEVDLDQTQLPLPTNLFSVPAGAERPVTMVGPLEPGNFGLGPDAFGRADGVLLSALMRRLDAPLPSRWTSILLRRALLSRVPAPPRVDPVDWVAERASLLLRMGEADAARMLVQAVDVEDYTPRMVEVAAQTALATADPAALCPLVGPARGWSNDTVWTLADGMCAGLEGEAARASALIDQARGQAGTSVDLLLAEKVVGSGAETRRAVDIDWQGVTQINPWRFGLASAVGLQIPPPLMARAGPQIQAWLARAPMVPLEQRLNAASVAASLGVLSSHSLVEIYSLMLDQTDPAEQAGTVGARLRSAWIEGDPARRVEAMRSLWTESQDPVERHARLILTAGAAARIPPVDAFAADAPNLIAAMLCAGMDRQAARWAPLVEASGNADRAWAMLAVGAPRPMVSVDGGKLQSFARADDSPGGTRSLLFVAALAGLGRITPDQAAQAGLRLGDADPWTDAIDAATRDRAPGTIALLAGVGMQTRNWTGVPPAYLYRIVRALRAVGMDYEARMIAAEAMARL